MGVRRGSPRGAARRCFWMVDSKGMITANRGDELTAEKQLYARHDNGSEQHANLLDTVRYVRPTALIGLAGVQGGEFTEEILREVASYTERPIVFALSNPTSKAECSAESAYRVTAGKVIFASGSPFDSVEIDGVVHVPGQANNAFIFPGLGFGSSRVHAREVTDGMILASAEALASQVTAEELAQGRIVPSMQRVRDVSLNVAVAVMDEAYRNGVAQLQPRPDNLLEYVRSSMYVPDYLHQLTQDSVE